MPDPSHALYVVPLWKGFWVCPILFNLFFLSDKDISREFQSRLFKIFDSLIFTNFPISRQLGDKKRTEAWYYETLMSVHSSRLWLKTLVLDAYCVHVKDDCVSQAMAMSSDPRAERHLDVGNLILFEPRSRFPSARTVQKRAVVFAKRTRYINWRFKVKRKITSLQKIFWMLLQSWTWTQLRLQRGAW